MEVKQGCAFGSTEMGVKEVRENGGSGAGRDEQTCRCPDSHRLLDLLSMTTIKQKIFISTKRSSLLKKKEKEITSEKQK